MMSQIGSFLIETVFGLFVYVALLRFYMQVFRAPFRNPIGQFVMALTDWAVLPLRRLVPSAGGLDLASLFLAWLAQIVKLVLLYALAGASIGAVGVAILLLSLVELVQASLHLLMFVVIVQVVISWVSQYNPFAPVFDALTRPFYNVFRRVIPPIGSIDLSPLFVIVLAQVLLIVLNNASRSLLTAL